MYKDLLSIQSESWSLAHILLSLLFNDSLDFKGTKESSLPMVLNSCWAPAFWILSQHGSSDVAIVGGITASSSEKRDRRVYALVPLLLAGVGGSDTSDQYPDLYISLIFHYQIIYFSTKIYLWLQTFELFWVSFFFCLFNENCFITSWVSCFILVQRSSNGHNRGSSNVRGSLSYWRSFVCDLIRRPVQAAKSDSSSVSNGPLFGVQLLAHPNKFTGGRKITQIRFLFFGSTERRQAHVYFWRSEKKDPRAVLPTPLPGPLLLFMGLDSKELTPRAWTGTSILPSDPGAEVLGTTGGALLSGKFTLLKPNGPTDPRREELCDGWSKPKANVQQAHSNFSPWLIDEYCTWVDLRLELDLSCNAEWQAMSWLEAPGRGRSLVQNSSGWSSASFLQPSLLCAKTWISWPIIYISDLC